MSSVIAKFSRAFYIIGKNGGLLNSALKLWRFDTLKEGKLVGEDEFGSKYYENPYYMIGRSRWVEHADFFGWDYDASQVPAQWFGWLHYRTDRLPCEEPTRTHHPWMSCCNENFSGTTHTYVPWSTTVPSTRPWDGRSQATRDENEFQDIKPFDGLKKA